MFALATPLSPRHARVTRSTMPVGHARRGIARWAAGATLVLAGAAAHAQGVDWTLIGGASDTARVRQVGVVAGWTRPAPRWQGDAWRLRLRHEGVLAAWHVPQARDVVEVGYSPVLRMERPLQGSANVFFVEGSIGVRLLSHTRMADDHHMSTAFQFADMLGAGMQFGQDGRSTLGVRLQHLSNLGIKKPNPGINFVQVYYAYRF